MQRLGLFSLGSAATLAGLLVLGTAGCGDTAVVTSPPDFARPDLQNCQETNSCPCEDDTGCVSNPNGPRCDKTTHQCVTCLPSPDNCPNGQVCQQVNGAWLCVNTCAGNADCQKLGGGSLCCGSFCVNPANDVKNCGACNAACPPVNNGTAGCSTGNCIVAACNPGWDDCDKAAINGCETQTGVDPNNCGACGMACKPFANGLPTCTAGKCAAICAPGYADCNNNTNDGCEIDTTYDIKNCGGCGKTCGAPANADPSCDQGKCGYRCKPGFADCDGNPANGCEVDNSGDINNCGHCGNICPLRPNAMSASCQAGQCINACNQGFGDCDNIPANGCESNLQTSLNACGACGKICKNNNAVATCSMGMCTLQCNAGFVDCNMDTADGCEANLLNDSNNCGACGNICPQNAPACSNGKCINGYFPVGVQQNVPVAMMAGWSQCWLETYGAAGSLAQVQAACSGSKIALACRPTGNPTLSLMAWAAKSDVFKPLGYCACCGSSTTGLNTVNGTSFYYDTSWAMGFVAAGDLVNLCSCDVQSGGQDAKRMCWHTSGSAFSSGYRCGTTYDYAGGTERVIYQAP